MQTTKNYGLKKPEVTDFYNVNDFNDNMDIIDEKLKDAGSVTDPTLSVEGAAADAKATGDAIKAIDSNSFYNQDEDTFYFKLADGTLHPFASGGVNVFDLNDLTKLSPEDWEFEYANNASGAEVTSNPFKFSMTDVSDTGKSNVTATTTKAFNLGSFNRFVMSGKIKGYLNQGSIANDYYHKIAFVNTTTGNEDYVWSDINSYTSATDISESAVISLDATASYKIRLRVFGYKGWVPSYFEFPNFRLYKEV